MIQRPTSLLAWADALDSLERHGGIERHRYVMISDEMVRHLADVLRAAHPLVQPVEDLGAAQ